MVSTKAQAQLNLVLDVITKVMSWTGYTYKAYVWYRYKSIDDYDRLPKDQKSWMLIKSVISTTLVKLYE